MVDGLMEFAALALAGMIGALMVEPTKVAVRETAQRVRSTGRRF